MLSVNSTNLVDYKNPGTITADNGDTRTCFEGVDWFKNYLPPDVSKILPSLFNKFIQQFMRKTLLQI